MAVTVPIEVKVADAEPVQGLLKAIAGAAAEFAKISDEEMASLPSHARTGISVLMDAAREFAGLARPRPAFCEHRPATAEERGRNCPECGLPMLWIPHN